MTDADFWLGIEMRPRRRQPCQPQSQRHGLRYEGREYTHPRFSWYSATVLMNSSYSSLRSTDSPRLGGILSVCGYPCHSYTALQARHLSNQQHAGHL